MKNRIPTIDKLDEFSDQEIFDYICEKLLAQNKKCIDKKGQCKYRKDDLRCAVGFLIPDEIYIKKIENERIEDVFQILRLKSNKENLLTDLQSIHDHWPIDEWRIGLRTVAKRHKLIEPDSIKALLV